MGGWEREWCWLEGSGTIRVNLPYMNGVLVGDASSVVWGTADVGV
jgi:hypothetical protein